jgi:uncharacterized Ntn-hydrolase superfamily protein
MMLKKTVLPAMAAAYEKAVRSAERMLAALDAAQAEGGDIVGNNCCHAGGFR